MFTLYKFGKVLSCEVCHTFGNLEQNSLSLFYFTSAQSLAASFPTKDSVVNQASTRKIMWTDTITEQYGKKSQVTIRKTIVPWMALGNKLEYESSNDFSFTQSTNPARIIHSAWVAMSPLNTIPIGITVTTTLNFRVLFYDALDLPADLFSAPSIPPTPVVAPEPTAVVCQRRTRH